MSLVGPDEAKFRELIERTENLQKENRSLKLQIEELETVKDIKVETQRVLQDQVTVKTETQQVLEDEVSRLSLIVQKLRKELKSRNSLEAENRSLKEEISELKAELKTRVEQTCWCAQQNHASHRASKAKVIVHRPQPRTSVGVIEADDINSNAETGKCESLVESD